MQLLLLCQLQIQLADVFVPWCCSHHLLHLYLFPLAPLQLHIHNAQGEDCRLGLLDMFQSNVDLRDSFGVFVPAKWTVMAMICNDFINFILTLCKVYMDFQPNKICTPSSWTLANDGKKKLFHLSPYKSV